MSTITQRIIEAHKKYNKNIVNIVKSHIKDDNCEGRSVDDILNNIIRETQSPSSERLLDPEVLAGLLAEQGTVTPVQDDKDYKFTVRLSDYTFHFEKAYRWQNSQTDSHSLKLSHSGGTYNTPASEQETAEWLNALNAIVAQVRPVIKEKINFLRKKEVLRKVNASRSQTLLQDTLLQKGLPFAIDYKDARAIVKVKVSRTRMVVLNVLYKNLEEEIPELLQAIDTLKSVIDKFGKYTFIASCKGIQWQNDTQAETDEPEQDSDETPEDELEF